MRFDIITIFPEAFSYLNESILKRAQKKKLVKIRVHNLRDFARDKHKMVDDRPYGGGAGMVLKVEPIYEAIKFLKEEGRRKIKNKTRVILLSAKGKRFTQRKARSLSRYERIIFICGHYEGVDERVAKHIADEEVSMGDYVLTGGELPAMVVLDAVTRNIPGVIRSESLKNESYSANSKDGEKILEHPHYTRPLVFVPTGKKGRKEASWAVPKVLLGGSHAKIEQWRKKHAKRVV